MTYKKTKIVFEINSLGNYRVIKTINTLYLKVGDVIDEESMKVTLDGGSIDTIEIVPAK